MATIKCKMCGGDLNVTEGMTVAECEYCGTKQTVPNVDNEKKLTLFSRANRLRLACEFDKAAGVYENVVSEFPTEAEAYWGLVLCRYGIEYVDDPATGKKVPTCHRSSFDSILEDSDFEQACENADAIARRVYRDEAKTIEDIRKGILEVSGKEPPYDIFICYKETDDSGERTVDSVLAQDVYDALTDKGYRVFFSRITLEDKLGTEYEPYIFAALNSAKVMLVFGTDYEYFNAVWVKNEWSRFLKLMAHDKSKHLIPCYKDVDAYDMPKEFQKLQGQDMGKVGAVQDLLRGIDKLLGKGQAAQSTAPAQAPGGPTVESLLKRGQMFLEDGNWDSANEYFDKVLDLAPECGAAYSGKLCCELQYHALSDVAEHPEQLEKIRASKMYQRAVQYGDPELAGHFAAATETEFRRLSGRMEQAETLSELHALVAAFHKLDGRPDAEGQIEKCREKMKLLQEQKVPELAAARARIAPAAGRLAFNGSVVIGVKPNGSVLLDGPGLKKDYHDAVVWKNITAVAASTSHIMGLKADGTVVTAGNPNAFNLGQCELGDWNDIAGIAGGFSRSVGVRRDGTAVFKGSSTLDYSDMGSWTDIVAAASGRFQTVGLRSDGTVVTVGGHEKNLHDADSWTGIVAVACGDEHTVGLRADGTVAAVGDNGNGQCDVGDWDDIVAIAAGKDYTIGVKADGTVRTAGYYKIREAERWTEIAAVSARFTCVAGLKTDGTVVLLSTAEEPTYGSYTLSELKKKEKKKPDFDVSGWRLFRSIGALEEEQREAVSGSASIAALAAARARIQCAAGVLVTGGDRTNGSITIGRTVAGSLEVAGSNAFKECSTIKRWKGINAVLTDWSWAIGLKSNGTVIAKVFDDSDDDGGIDTSPMKNVVSIAFGASHVAGLRKNGTVIAVGGNDNKQCDVSSWKNITAIACGWDWTVGLRADGTAVSTHNWRYEHEIDLSGWSGITAIAAGSYHIVGLKADGTVVATGTQLGVDDGQCAVESWSDVVQIICRGDDTIGLRADGTVLITGALLHREDSEEQVDVSDWRDIIALDCRYDQLVGLKADGTVVLTGRTGKGQCDVSGWRDIVAVAAGDGYTLGLRADGTVLATGDNQYGQCDVSGWKLFNSVDTLEQERAEVENQAEKKRKEAQKRAEAEKEKRRAALETERTRLQAELPTIKGLFSGGKRRQIESRLVEIETELKKL